MSKSDFYIGRIFDLQKNKMSDQPLLYDPDDLTTHAVVTGMTGSGKTGLCIGLLEEAALKGIPALMIDPKGDLTNLLLHFPELAPADFQPWIDADAVRRQGKTVEQAADETAALWKNGLGDWNIFPERIRELKDSVHFAIYTPGSDAGLPISVLSSFDAPEISWEENRELLRERIASTVTALLGLVGMDDVDPLRTREHILLSNIFENAWSKGQNLDMTELILKTQNPPFEKLGAFPVENFFPEKDRFELAMLLNNILASPAFQSWREGQPLDIASLLYHKDGRPRHTIFYLAHLSDSERMFFITLLLSLVETWMRMQSGSSTLRALLYFDEIFGYLPPLSNPPSKQPLLRMLKQARAFGLGLLLATQNPVDVDYKGLSNTGSWFIGKLQTDRDKQRLLDGLESAAGGLDRRAFDHIISGLGKRVFLMHNVHEKKPVLFNTRWVMNYLAGPLTRTQIPALNRLAGADKEVLASEAKVQARDPSSATVQAPVGQPSAKVSEPAAKATRLPGSQTKPTVPSGVMEYYLPLSMSLTEAVTASGETVPGDSQLAAVLYRPAILASSQIRFLDRKYGVDTEVKHTLVVENPDRRGIVRWDDYPNTTTALKRLDRSPSPQSRFGELDVPFTDSKAMKSLEKDFKDWAYRTVQVKVKANETLKVFGGPDVSQAEFRKACADTAREGRDSEIDKIKSKYDRKIATIQNRLEREERELRQDEEEYSQRKMEEMGTHAENIFGMVTGKRSSRRLSSSLSKRRMTQKAKADVEESVDAIAAYEEEIAELEKTRDEEIRLVKEEWAEVANEMSEFTISPRKSDVHVEQFGVAWIPVYLIRVADDLIEMPAFGMD